MQLSFDVRIPDGLLAANALLNEKPHQGVPSWNLALHQGIDERNSTAAIGIRASAQLNRIWPRYTGKERDAESGLDYFGARYYGSSMGRFISPDPSRLSIFFDNPQTWNRYTYGLNNPLRFKDDNGKWPTEIHNQVIDKAFPMLSAEQRQILKNVSERQDNVFYGGQANDLAYEHAMRSPGESVGEAESQYNNFVDKEEGFAVDAQTDFWLTSDDVKLSNLSPEALDAFGEALHAVLDSTSPAHAGFQEWNWMNLPTRSTYMNKRRRL